MYVAFVFSKFIKVKIFTVLQYKIRSPNFSASTEHGPKLMYYTSKGITEMHCIFNFEQSAKYKNIILKQTNKNCMHKILATGILVNQNN